MSHKGLDKFVVKIHHLSNDQTGKNLVKFLMKIQRNHCEMKNTNNGKEEQKKIERSGSLINQPEGCLATRESPPSF